MKKRLIVLLVSISVMMMACATWTMSTMSENVPRITKDELKAMLDNPDIIIIDVRHDQDWKGSDVRIKGAVREDPDDVKSWAHKYANDRRIVLYCAWPDEGTSASVAQKLIGMGFTNVYALKGGWNEWFKPNYPMEKK